MTVDLLCRVVDNLGDVGVAWRLARALADEGARVRLVVDGLDALEAIEPAIDPRAAEQTREGIRIYPWSAAAAALDAAARDAAVRDAAARDAAAHDAAATDAAGPVAAVSAGDSSAADPPLPLAIPADYRDDPPRFIVECFACGRPEWLEGLLFGPDYPGRAAIVDLEYLSAEGWVPGFHRLPSATRSERVRKWLFMPGFGPGTGGLTMGRDFMAAMEGVSADPPGSRLSLIGAIEGRGDAPSPILPRDAADRFWFLAFSYEMDYAVIMDDLARFAGDQPFLLLAAPGRGFGGIRSAWEGAGRPFPLAELPYLPQPLWDELLLDADFAIVRGEDSLSRAALGGKPFLWQAYPQESGPRLAKARALGDLVRGNMPLGHRPAYSRLVDAVSGGGEFRPGDLLGLLRSVPALAPAFRSFADFCAAPGELERNLLTFFREIM